MTEPTGQRIEERARKILAKAKGRPGAAMTPRQAKLLAESQLRHEDALSAAYARGLRDAREIAAEHSERANTLIASAAANGASPNVLSEFGTMGNTADDIVAALNARLSAIPDATKSEGDGG